MAIEELYASCGKQGRDAALECHRLTCKVCGGFQEGCICPDPIDPNYEYKHKPVVSTDCSLLDHASCEGQEPALWPDGDTTIRTCSCACHNFDPNSVYVGDRKL